MTRTEDVRAPSVVDAVIPLATLVVLIGGSLALFGPDALDGPLQVAPVLCAMVAALVALKNGHRWEEIQAGGRRAMSSITSAIFILLAVGALIGIQVLSPTWCYAASALICGIVAMSIGSSWTAGTIDVGVLAVLLLQHHQPAAERALRLHRTQIEKVDPADTEPVDR